MKPLLAAFLLSIAVSAAGTPDQIHYLPSLIYGHVLAGTAPTRYETILFVKSDKNVRVRIDIFNDQGKPMRASFADMDGHIAAADESFAFTLHPDRALQVKIQLPPETDAEEIAVNTGWATVSGLEELEVSGVVRVTTPDGRFVTSHPIRPEPSTRS